ncbi:hypothetical protein SAMN05444161_7019 [Rhizobiales bacterium GAS191]|nr:hypothetical protein SAMN05519103_06321 [Rhizobiales bacterium GAS113]SEE75524.1 hypothetical protein SAMN05444161_7019 [Rhizobiales bacterium GAS191]
MASDNHVAAALTAYATEVGAVPASSPIWPGISLLRKQIFGAPAWRNLAAEIEALAANPRAATYQGFERIQYQVWELGASPAEEIAIGVATAFLQRPYIRPKL